MAHTHEQPAGHLPGRPGHEVGLYARVFAVNAAILVLIFCVFVFTPLSVNPDPTRDQVYVLVGGLVLMLAANAVLLRVSLSPLRRLAELMGTVDVLRPGARLQASGSSEVTTVITAFNATLARLEAERQASTRRVITAQEAERRRIAQELHDQIGQNLTAVMLELKRAQSMPAKDADDAVADAVELARESLEELHRISYRLRPLVLDDLGLVSALAALCEGVSQHTGMAVRTDLDQPATPLHPEQELAVYRVAQEA